MTKSGVWAPDSWRLRPIQQQPVYQDAAHVERVIKRIKGYPPLVFSGEIESLKSKLKQVGRGELFLLQGGDCAERFVDCNAEAITQKLKIMLQMSVVLSYGARKPVLRIGRIAGQYSKPRSSDAEDVGGISFPSYRGDAVNSIEADQQARKPDPERLIQSYTYSAMTLNYIRALTRGGFADLHNVDDWNVDFVTNPHDRERYQQMVDTILDVISFMESLGSREEKLGWVDFFTSHEGLHLAYEEAHTRYVQGADKYYNLGAHMLWIGDRTRALDGAHVEYFRGIANPVGLKIGPSVTPKEVVQLVQALNPDNSEGRVVLITRFGCKKVQQCLPPLIDGIRAADLNIVWTTDPMHGNGINTNGRLKTRSFDDILSELKLSHTIHQKKGTILGGVHFELTGENVTECIGGASGIGLDDLLTNYQTHCDPRLNYCQSLEMAFQISAMLKPASTSAQGTNELL